jgi:hypothetical protein
MQIGAKGIENMLVNSNYVVERKQKNYEILKPKSITFASFTV